MYRKVAAPSCKIDMGGMTIDHLDPQVDAQKRGESLRIR